jgi:hypothetical protein
MTGQARTVRVRVLLVLAVLPLSACHRAEPWTAVAFPTTAGDTVAQLRDGIAVGSHRGERTEPRWWQDGPRGWQAGRMAFEPFSEDGAHARLLSLTRGGDRVAAIGYAVSALHGSQRPVLFQADGAGPLRETYLLRELFGGPRLISTGRIASGPAGFLAVGTRSSPGASDRPAAQVWQATSPPDWARLDDEPGLASRPGEQVWGNDIAVGPGRAVVVGRRDVAGQPNDAAAWFSDAGGRAWQRVGSLDGRSGPQQLDRVAAMGTGFVAAGSSNGAVEVWRSADGSSWTHRALDAPVPPGGVVDLAVRGRSYAVSVVADGRVAVFLDGHKLPSLPGRERATAAAVGFDGGDNLVVAVTTAAGVRVYQR